MGPGTDSSSHFAGPSEYLLVIPLKELQEAGLSASGALHSPEAELITDTLQVLEVHAEILNPKAAAFPNRGQLSRPEGSTKRTQGSHIEAYLHLTAAITGGRGNHVRTGGTSKDKSIAKSQRKKGVGHQCCYKLNIKGC